MLTLLLSAAATNTEGHVPPWWLLLPFLAVLGMIATFPIFFKRFWHQYHPHTCLSFGLAVPLYYILKVRDYGPPVHAFFEYFQFISLIFSLYVASNLIGIRVSCDKKSTANTIFLFAGALLANFIGTTGASMLLIKPFVDLNKGRIQAYHIVFFIFIISNVGGALTPIGDPPLFLGFLKGVPFFWMIKHISGVWFFAMACLLTIFYLIDSKNKGNSVNTPANGSFKITLIGGKNTLWLALIIGVVFLDPNLIDGLPYIAYGTSKISFLRELIMLFVGFFSPRYTSKKILAMNSFNMYPMREVAFLFVGIFGTMIPALLWIKHHGGNGMEGMLTPSVLYWSTGVLSGFLDNAPTYFTLLAASMANHGADVNSFSQVTQYANGTITEASVMCLRAISLSAVFFGALTYIGNGPNFMVRSIAENLGIEMPNFLQYLVRYSLCILLPVLVLVWFLFIGTT